MYTILNAPESLVIEHTLLHPFRSKQIVETIANLKSIQTSAEIGTRDVYRVLAVPRGWERAPTLSLVYFLSRLSFCNYKINTFCITII